MFNKTGIALIIGILCLSSWSWWQSQMISSLETTNRTQAQTIAEQKTVNEQLEISLQTEKQAVEQQSALVAQFRRQAIDKKEVVRYVLKDNQCANQHLPSAVIKQLQ